MVAAWQKNLAVRWQQCRIHGFGWRYGGIERSVQWQQQCEGASLCEGESEFTSDFSIGKCRTQFFSLLCKVQHLVMEFLFGRNPVGYQMISIRDRVDP
jgi:hypothetical protein